MQDAERTTDIPPADGDDGKTEVTNQVTIKDVATPVPPERKPGVPDMQVINGTPWLGLV